MSVQGRPQDLGGGGGQEFFLRFGNLHVAERHVAHGFSPCAMLGAGVGLPGGPRPAKRPSGQPDPYYGWPGWPAIIFHEC